MRRNAAKCLICIQQTPPVKNAYLINLSRHFSLFTLWHSRLERRRMWREPFLGRPPSIMGPLSRQ